MANLGYGYCPTHPGELLKEEIVYRKLTQSKLAKQIGLPYTALNDILNERRTLTPKTAMLFEAALGINADMLMRMQLKYNIQTTKQNKTFARRLAKIREMAAVL